jgi:carboxyl-terminal processing protease
VIGKQNEKEYSLQIDQYKKDQKEMRDVQKDIERLSKLASPMQIAFLKQDENKYYSADKDKTERYKQWLTNISKDVYVDEAVKVMNDIITHPANGKGKPVAANK